MCGILEQIWLGENAPEAFGAQGRDSYRIVLKGLGSVVDVLRRIVMVVVDVGELELQRAGRKVIERDAIIEAPCLAEHTPMRLICNCSTHLNDGVFNSQSHSITTYNQTCTRVHLSIHDLSHRLGSTSLLPRHNKSPYLPLRDRPRA